MKYEAIRDLQAHASKTSKHLGTLVWWHVGQTAITFDALRARAAEHALDAWLLPAAVKPIAAFRRAWRAASRKTETGLMLREICETDEAIVVGVVRERADVEHLELEYEVVGKLRFDKQAEAVVVLDRSPIADEVAALFEHHKQLTADDLRAMLVTFVKSAGVSIRDSGGVYFVPPAYQPTIDALTRVVESTGKSRVFSLAIADSGTAQATLADLARDTLDAEVRAIQDELASFEARGREVRDATLVRRLEQYEALRARAQLMAQALSFKADGLMNEVQRLQDDLRRRLGLPVQSAVDAAVPPTLAVFDEAAGF